jgi:formylmethanofuran dehydrogenase subunit C
MGIILEPKYLFKVPVEAECISPDSFAEKNLEQISKLELWEGNKKRNLNELFNVTGKSASKPENVSIEILADVHKVRRIGSSMTAGKIDIQGDAGLHLGEEMTGGQITVAGNAGSWTGAMMKNGLIEVKGNVGEYVGAAYRGSMKGMGGGTIIIHGNAGNEVGCFMRKGLIKVHGNVGQLAGIHMQNGTIFVGGNSEGRDGAEMTGGKIVVCGQVASVLPTFTIESIKANVKINGDKTAGPFYLFAGDRTEDGNGKLYVSKTSNPQLNQYEKFL